MFCKSSKVLVILPTDMFDYFKKNKKLFFVTVVFFLVQLPFLDQLSLLRGERDIMLSGFSLAKTGKDLYGNLLSLEFLGIDPFVPFVPIYIAALWWLIIPVKSVFTARLLFIIISTLIPFLIHEIVKHITGHKKLAFWTAVIFVFSPGVFHLSRLALEIGIAFPLLLAGILATLKKKHIFAYFSFFLSFFSYHGFRPLIPVLLVYLAFFEYLRTRQLGGFLKKSAVHILFFVVLVGLSIIIDGNLMQSRINDVAFSNFEKWSNEVIYRRNTSIAPKVITVVFDNKMTALFQYMRDVFIKGMDLRYLFLSGDESSLYATTFTGQFFLTCAIFYFLGILYLAKKAKKNYYYMAFIIIIGLVPSVVNISYISYSIRSMLSSVGHSFLIACGLMLFFEFLPKATMFLKKIIVFLLVVIFMVEFGYFAYNYYARRTITMSEMFFESERSVAKYMLSHDKPYKIYTHVPRDVFFSYLFFNNKADMRKAQEIAKAGRPYKIDGFVIDVCPVNPHFTHRKEMIMDTCLTEKEYHQYVVGKKFDDLIPYTNYSFKNAYFIFN